MGPGSIRSFGLGSTLPWGAMLGARRGVRFPALLPQALVEEGNGRSRNCRRGEGTLSDRQDLEESPFHVHPPMLSQWGARRGGVVLFQVESPVCSAPC